MFAHPAEARAAQGAHPHGFCGSSLPGHSHVPAPSLRERGRKTVLALSPINTKKGTSSGSQELLPEAHYRELAGFKQRKRRGRSQILWDCLESAESKVKHRTLGRALALGSKQPGLLPAAGAVWPAAAPRLSAPACLYSAKVTSPLQVCREVRHRVCRAPGTGMR